MTTRAIDDSATTPPIDLVPSRALKRRGRRVGAFTALALAGSLALAGCGAGRTDDPATGESDGGDSSSAASIIVGTTDKLTALDPAGNYDNGSYTVEIQVFQFLYGFKPGEVAPQPDVAESCDYAEPTVFRCTVKEGLKFANGHDLTASDVAFSFTRQLTINDANGPASLLANLDSVEATDDVTVDFHLKNANDQTFLQILATPAGPIVDEEVFSATALTSGDDIVAGNAFSGPYTITNFQANDTISFTPYADYIGVQDPVANGGVTLKTYEEGTNLSLAITNGDIDVAYRSLTPTDIDTLKQNSDVVVHEGPGGEIRYINFNFNTMPGDTPEQKFAVRQAIASLVDRDALSTQVYKGLYTPLCSYVPDGQDGATSAVCDTYPLDEAAAAKYLADAGVATPVTLALQYNPDHYGDSSDQEYALIKSQLEASGLFAVQLQATEWVSYQEERIKDTYPAYQFGWFPDFPDPDNYISPFFVENSMLQNHFSSPEIQALITAEVTESDHDARMKIIEQIQLELAQKYLPTLPLLQGTSIAVSRADVDGVVLDASFQFRYSTLSK
ncbi:MAG: ABC transporter substrate-binding protein [Propionibacteriaceae bacterium]|jgi:peptide/nickel transport system substrate-binding protein|nr:ABC transporter substrate-binding protein [Propionibacteriaceae bacterium]